MHIVLILYAAAALVAARALLFLYQSLTSPLRDVPGPLAARYTRFWYLRQILNGQFHTKNIALHQKYGAVVRVAPNMYSINAPDKSVYGIGSKFTKSEWYEGWKHPSPDRWTLFPDRNEKRHAETRRKFQAIYSMSSLVSYESYVETCTDILCKRLQEFDKENKVINMGHWFQCYAFDVIGDITYSKRFGFLDQGADVGGLLKALHRAMIYASCIGVYASLHPFVYGLTEWLPNTGAAGRNYLMGFVREQIAERNKQRAERSIEEKEEDIENGAPQDFLDKITNASEENPQKVTPYHIFMMNLSNIVAGSDTTAVTLSGILYHLIRTPRAMQKLRDEVKQFENEGQIQRLSVKFATSQDMPYLQAVIKEGLRMHAATGLPLWREVPAEGAEVCGRYFPGGSVVGLNAWVAHYDENVFGKDVFEFRPERWIEAEAEGGERLKQMNTYHMPFGLGSRTCLGRHISVLEISKLVPVLVRNFDFELERPGKEWSVNNYWFVKPTDFRVKVNARKDEE